MNASQPNWTEIACPEKRGEGQRFFRKNDNDRIYICDNSGSTPDQTDDGALYIDHEREVVICLSGGGLTASIPVVAEHKDNGHYFCGCTMKELLWLYTHGHIDGDSIEIDDEQLLAFAAILDGGL